MSDLREQGMDFVTKLQNPDKLIPYQVALDRIRDISNIVDLSNIHLAPVAPWPGLIKSNGFYSVITAEFMSELQKELVRRNLLYQPAIEICAGRGVLSYLLDKAGANIVAIDDGSDDRTHGKSLAPKTDELNHKQALEKYQPKLVVGCWIPEVPEIGEDVLDFPSVDYFLDIGEVPRNATWLRPDYHPEHFKLLYLHSVRKYAIGTSDYFWKDRTYSKLKFQPHTEVRLWKRKGAPMSIRHDSRLRSEILKQQSSYNR